jgi:FKBP-type peptidyl-prolyl cis-trans isomerase 2
VVDVVSRQTAFHPTDVRCPSGVEAKVGQEFDCHFTGPEGKPYTAHMRITNVNGDQVTFDVNSRPSQG